jgi:peroxiredoxin
MIDPSDGTEPLSTEERMKIRPITYALIGVVLVAGCGRGSDNKKAIRSGAQSSEKSAAADPKARGVQMKEYGFPDDERLGVLPPGVGIPVGKAAPDARVQDADGREIELHDLFKTGPILLVFYRGGWCPFCNFEIHELTTRYPEFRERGLTPVAISVDRIEESSKTQATYEIPFPVLSDPDLAAHRSYQVVQQVDETDFERLMTFGIDIEKSSGRTHHVIAIPSLFLIDRDGFVRWAHADSDYKVRPSTDQILAAIDRLAVRGAQ